MEHRILLDLILKWAPVYNHKGDFKGLNELLLQYEDLAKSLGDKSQLGMYYAWLGFTVWIRGKARDGYSYLSKALTLGEETEDFLVIAYACTWLTWACWDLGFLEKGVRYGERAQELQRKYFPENHYIHFSSLGGVGHICSATGESRKALAIGQQHIDLEPIGSQNMGWVMFTCDSQCHGADLAGNAYVAHPGNN
jgi:tetratricopeptide (TPR) repeat protein